MSTTPTRRPKRFLARQPNGHVRVRMKWTNEEATMIEEAAGDMPPVEWLYKTINDAATRKVKRDRQRQHIEPPLKEQA